MKNNQTSSFFFDKTRVSKNTSPTKQSIATLQKKGLKILNKDIIEEYGFSWLELEFLYAQRNLLTNILTFPPSLQAISLQNNKIQKLWFTSDSGEIVSAFKHMLLLKELDVSQNMLGILPENLFSTCNSLTTINLSQNMISRDFKCFVNVPCLESLHLKLNSIRDVNLLYELFDCKSLLFLDISKNPVAKNEREIERYSLKFNSQLTIKLVDVQRSKSVCEKPSESTKRSKSQICQNLTPSKKNDEQVSLASDLSSLPSNSPFLTEIKNREEESTEIKQHCKTKQIEPQNQNQMKLVMLQQSIKMDYCLIDQLQQVIDHLKLFNEDYKSAQQLLEEQQKEKNSELKIVKEKYFFLLQLFKKVTGFSSQRTESNLMEIISTSPHFFFSSSQKQQLAQKLYNMVSSEENVKESIDTCFI